MKDLQNRIAELRELEALRLADALEHENIAELRRAEAAAYSAHVAGIEEALEAFAEPEAPKPKRGRPPGKKTAVDRFEDRLRARLESTNGPHPSSPYVGQFSNTPSPEQSRAPEALEETSSG